jgi:hypothetical protein
MYQYVEEVSTAIPKMKGSFQALLLFSLSALQTVAVMKVSV